MLLFLNHDEDINFKLYRREVQNQFGLSRNDKYFLLINSNSKFKTLTLIYKL